MDLTAYRASDLERQRSTDLLRLIPPSGKRALDIGARDGHFSILMAARFTEVIALDLTKPTIAHPGVECVEGNAAALPFQDNDFDFVFCAEVLEHIPPDILPKVCREIERVTNKGVLIGVPFKQDIRVGRTTCYACGHQNPPWGHVNSFKEDTLSQLFSNCRIENTSFIGTNRSCTNTVSTALMDFAGNPYGTYDQEEPCIHCNKPLDPPPQRSLTQLLATKLAFWSRSTTELFSRPHGNWMHSLMSKNASS